MISSLIKKTIIYGLGNVSGALVALFLLPVLTKTFTPSQYGLIELISITILIISSVAGFNLESSILRFYHEGERSKRSIVISTVVITGIFSSLFFTILAVAFFSILKINVFAKPQAMVSLYISLASIPFMVFLTNILAFLMIQQKAFYYAIISFFKVALTLILTIILVKIFPLGIAGVFLSNLIVHIIISLVCFIYFKRYFIIAFSTNDFKKAFFYSSPLIFSNLAWILLGNINKYFLQSFHGSDSVGIYSVGLEISMSLGILGAAFRQAWIPQAFSIIDKEDAKLIYSKAFKYFISTFFIAAFLLVIMAKKVLLIFSSEKYLSAAMVIGYLCVGIIFMNLGLSFFNLGIYIKKKTVFSAIAYSAGLITNIIFNLLLIPKYSITGASIALMLGYMVTSAMLLYFSNREYPIPYNLKLLFFISVIYFAFVFIWNNTQSTIFI